MGIVPVKSEDIQGAAMVFRIRELLIRQRTQAINALRGHLGKFGQIVPQEAANAARRWCQTNTNSSQFALPKRPVMQREVRAIQLGRRRGWS